MHRKRNAICAAPPARIAQQTTVMRVGTSRPGKKHSVPSVAIQMRLRNAGMNAPSTNRPSAFRTPIPNAAPQMKIMYGKSILTSFTVRTLLAPSSRFQVPGSKFSKTDSPVTAKATTAPRIRKTIVITARARRFADSTSPRSTSPLKTGTNAAVSAPSPKSFRAMLGIANASVKADCSTPAPMRRDCSISRTSPSTLLKAVKPPTVNTCLRKVE